MAIRKTAQLGHPVLRQTACALEAAELGSSRTQRLIDDLIDTLRDADGVGLAAPQIHEPIRVCVLESRQNPRYPEFEAVPLSVIVNPELEAVEEDGWVAIYEGCLSIPGLRGQVQRAKTVRVRGLDRRGDPLSATMSGFPAIIVQHEVDHLNGVVFLDRAIPHTLTFQREMERFVLPSARLTSGLGAPASLPLGVG